MMKILFTSDLAGMGGGETSLVNLCIALKKECTVFVLCARNGKLVDILNGLDIQTYVLNYRNKKKLIHNSLYIRKIIKENNIECIHNNDPLTSVIMKFASLGLKCRNYWTCHGQWYEFKHIKRLFIKWSNKHVFCVSTAVKDNLYRMKFKNISVSYLGIPVKNYENYVYNKNEIREELGIENNAFLIGCVGRFQRIKGQLKLVRAIEKLIENYPYIKLLLIGGCIFNNSEEKKYYNEIKTYVSTHKIGDKILFLGERSDIPSIMHQIDLLAIPSDNESFGMVAIEAMATGLPVITTPNDGVKEIMKNNNLIVSQSNDSFGLYQIIRNYLDNDYLKEKILNFEKQRVYDFDISIIAQKYLKEFNKE